MKNLKQKLRRQEGFTLMEMLLVVAIIGVLVAVSIPVVNTSLEKTRVATDAANERAAKSAIMVAYLTPGTKVSGIDGPADFATEETYYYNAGAGMLSREAIDEATAFGKCKEHSKCFLAVGVDTDGTFYIQWVDGPVTWEGLKAQNGSLHNGNVDEE